MAIATKMLCGRKVTRITGVQFFFDLLGRVEKEGMKIFLLGASGASNEGAFRKLIEKHPSLQIVGRQDGYFKDSEAVVQNINESGAELLFVAMGSPRQEFWIAEHRETITAPFCMGVGGTFDVIAGVTKRAPRWMQSAGMEWFYRFLQEPSRMWRRYLVGNSIFIWLVIKEKFKR